MAVTVRRPGTASDASYPKGENTAVADGHLFVLAKDAQGAVYNAAVYSPSAWLTAITTED